MVSGYQGHLHNFTVSSLTFQRTFTYSRAVLSKCLLKEANPKSLSRYFLPKTIRSSPIDFHSQRNDRSRRNCFKLGETGLPLKRRKPKASSRYPNIVMKPRLKKVRQISSFLCGDKHRMVLCYFLRELISLLVLAYRKKNEEYEHFLKQI